jgi:hypothetical protein
MAPTMPAMSKPAKWRPVHEARWANFRRLLDDRGLSMTQAATQLGRYQSQVSHVAGKRPIKIIGDELATAIEDTFSLPYGSLDAIHVAEPSVVHDERQSYAARMDMDILAEAVEVVSADEALNGVYSFPKHAAVLMETYQLLSRGESKLELVGRLTRQRIQEGEAGGEKTTRGRP